jgi:hypothetical protein
LPEAVQISLDFLIWILINKTRPQICGLVCFMPCLILGGFPYIWIILFFKDQ